MSPVSACFIIETHVLKSEDLSEYGNCKSVIAAYASYPERSSYKD
jgi:hypothetical protein